MEFSPEKTKALTDELEKSVDSGQPEDVIAEQFKGLIEMLSAKLVEDLKKIKAEVDNDAEAAKQEKAKVEEYKQLIGEIAHYIDNKLETKEET